MARTTAIPRSQNINSLHECKFSILFSKYLSDCHSFALFAVFLQIQTFQSNRKKWSVFHTIVSIEGISETYNLTVKRELEVLFEIYQRSRSNGYRPKNSYNKKAEMRQKWRTKCMKSHSHTEVSTLALRHSSSIEISKYSQKLLDL